MSLGNAFPVRSSVPDIVKVQGVWTGGGAAADCSHVATDWNRGIVSIVYTAATGIYTITFRDVGKAIVGWNISTGQQTGVNPLAFIIQNGSFSTATKSVIIEVSASDSGTLTDLLTTDKLYVNFEFAKNGPDA